MSRPRESNQHLPKYVTRYHGAFYYKAPKEKRIRICDADDEPAMYRFMADKLTPRGPIVTLQDCFDRYLVEVVPGLEPRTQKDYRSHLKKLGAVFGQMHPDDVKPRDIGKFLDVPKGKIARNRIVGVLSAVYTKAVGRWYVADRNPCRGVERNKRKARTRYVTDAEYRAFYAICNPRLQVAMDLALLTGQRQGDILKLRWSKVTKEGIEFKQGKTSKRLLVAMSDELEAVLNRARAFLPHLPREYVLRTEKGSAYTENGFRAMWQRAMRRASKGVKIRLGGGKRTEPILKERFTFHDLRAKSASDSVEFQQAYERLGHTSPSMTRAVYDRGVRKVQPLR